MAKKTPKIVSTTIHATKKIFGGRKVKIPQGKLVQVEPIVAPIDVGSIVLYNNADDGKQYKAKVVAIKEAGDLDICSFGGSYIEPNVRMFSVQWYFVYDDNTLPGLESPDHGKMCEMSDTVLWIPEKYFSQT